MAVTIDIKDGATISYGKDGYRADRVAIVTGVTGTASQKMYNAINDVGLPNYGDAHPSISTIYLNELSAEVIDTVTIKVTLRYYDDPSTADGGQTTSRASVTTAVEETNEDISSNRLETRYGTTGVDYQKWFTAEVERPRVTFDFEYTESTFPKTTIDTYVGKINSAIWNSYAIETILCTGVNVDQQGDDYLVRVSFAYNPDTWAFNAVIKDKALPLLAHSSDPDAGISLTTGVRAFDVYNTVDFTPLGLTL